MNYLAGTFLLAGASEEMAFWLLSAVVERVLPQSYFTSSLVGAQVDQKVRGRTKVGGRGPTGTDGHAYGLRGGRGRQDVWVGMRVAPGACGAS